MNEFITRQYWAVALALLFPVVAYAQEEEAVVQPTDAAIEKGIAFVNLARIFKESNFIDGHRQDISAEFLDREAELRGRIDQLAADRDKLLTEQLTMTDAQIQEFNNRISEEELSIQRDTRDLADDKRLRFDAAQRELEKMVLEVIQEISRGREDFIVFDLSTILFADSRLEITDSVIGLLDQKSQAAKQ